eukprot:GEMP01112515.1.p1 GENE.GEMP01112515.1~~GEMP01112515.1.p1  ORF type:complete len:164 (+),score=18.33 GEMP01112515.1:145-636(+)
MPPARQMNWIGGSKRSSKLCKKLTGRPKDVVRYKQRNESMRGPRAPSDPLELLDRQAQLVAQSLNPGASSMEINRQKTILAKIHEEAPASPTADPLADVIMAQCPEHLRPDAYPPKQLPATRYICVLCSACGKCGFYTQMFCDSNGSFGTPTKITRRRAVTKK